MTKLPARTRQPYDVRLHPQGADVWSGPTDNDVIFGTVYSKGPGSHDHVEMATIWAAADRIMFPALARIRDRARTAVNSDSQHPHLDLAWIAEEAAAALPVPTIGDLNGTSPAVPALRAAADPLARVDCADGEWMPRMWDLALAATDNESAATALTLKMVAASHGYCAVWVRQEVPDELADASPREILEAVAPPTDAPVEGKLVGRTMDEDGILNWFVRRAEA